jgi:hypothetical protein
MPDTDETTPENTGKDLSSEEKTKLLRELKERLKEIERLRDELGMRNVNSPAEEKSSREGGSLSSSSSNSSPSEDELSHPVSAGRVAEEVEELHVPSLEMLDDKPIPKKKKIGSAL